MEDYEVKKYKNSRFEMTYTRIGHGKKNMLMLPGMALRPVCLNADGIKEAFKIFLDDYTIYCFDKKDNLDANYSIENRTDDVIEVCKSLGLKDLYLYGVSLGGFMCQFMGFKYPDLVKKITIVSSSYYMNELGDEFMDKVIELVKQKDAKALTAYSLKMIYTKEFNGANKDSFIRAFADMSDYEMNQYMYEAISLKNVPYLLKEIEKIKVPTMIVASKKDKVFGFEPSLLMSLKIKDSECVLYDDYSHALYDEALDFKERMKKFFDR